MKCYQEGRCFRFGSGRSIRWKWKHISISKDDVIFRCMMPLRHLHLKTEDSFHFHFIQFFIWFCLALCLSGLPACLLEEILFEWRKNDPKISEQKTWFDFVFAFTFVSADTFAGFHAQNHILGEIMTNCYVNQLSCYFDSLIDVLPRDFHFLEGSFFVTDGSTNLKNWSVTVAGVLAGSISSRLNWLLFGNWITLNRRILWVWFYEDFQLLPY